MSVSGRTKPPWVPRQAGRPSQSTQCSLITHAAEMEGVGRAGQGRRAGENGVMSPEGQQEQREIHTVKATLCTNRLLSEVGVRSNFGLFVGFFCHCTD